jgi:hypothetical protein
MLLFASIYQPVISVSYKLVRTDIANDINFYT